MGRTHPGWDFQSLESQVKGSRFGVKRLVPIQEEKEQGLITFGVYKILQAPNEENRLVGATAMSKPILIFPQEGVQASR